MAQSGHNIQPWFIKHIEPYHWIVCNDKTRWLPVFNPTQRETILSFGAFIQTVEYTAANAGYHSKFTVLAITNQDENVMEVKLIKASVVVGFDIDKIKHRRMVRLNFLNDVTRHFN